MSRRRTLLACALLPVVIIIGLDQVALRLARAERTRALGQLPSHTQPDDLSSGPTVASHGSGDPPSAAPDAREDHADEAHTQEHSAPPPNAPDDENVVAYLVETARAVAISYGTCRDVGTWPLKLQKERAMARLQEPGLSEADRLKALEAASVVDSVFASPVIRWGMIGCGALGPSEAPLDLLHQYPASG
jgi:hypothetical protein